METRANYVLIGAFVLMGAIALALFTVWIAGSPFNRSYNEYDVVFTGPVNGLSEGGEVRFNGIKVGEVQRLSLDREDPNRVIARVRVASETPVRTDSVAQLDFLGITGVTFIQIRAGSADKPLLRSDEFDEPPVIMTERTALDELFSGGQDLMSVTGDTLNNFNRMLSDENVESITGILNNLEIITNKLAQYDGVIDRAGNAVASFDRAAIALASAAESVDVAAQDISAVATGAQPAIDDLGPAMADAREAIANLSNVAASLESSLTPTAGRALEQFSLAAADLRVLMGRLNGLVGEVEQDPSRLLVRVPQPTE